MYIVIAGGGKIGEYLATVLLKSGNEVAIIEKNASIADRLHVAARPLSGHSRGRVRLEVLGGRWYPQDGAGAWIAAV